MVEGERDELFGSYETSIVDTHVVSHEHVALLSVGGVEGVVDVGYLTLRIDGEEEVRVGEVLPEHLWRCCPLCAVVGVGATIHHIVRDVCWQSRSAAGPCIDRDGIARGEVQISISSHYGPCCRRNTC